MERNTMLMTLRYVGSSMVLLLVLFLSGCGSEESHPDVDHVEIAFELNRVDQLLRDKDSLELIRAISILKEKDEVFAGVYFNSILPLGRREGDTSMIPVLSYFLNADIRQLSDTVDSVYPNDDFLETTLTRLFQFYRYYFPQETIPNVYTYHSAFNYGVISIDETIMGIGLDFFLGEDFEAYHPSLFPDFVRRTMEKEFLASQVAKVLIKNLIPPLEEFRLLDRMVYEGKILYVNQLLQPDYPDSLIFHYSNDKIDWINNNEVQIWAMILKQEWLYSQKTSDWVKMVSPSPSGPSTMPAESPGEAGSWIGAKIIAEFMRRNPEMSLREMLSITNSQEILDRSKYKPR